MFKYAKEVEAQEILEEADACVYEGEEGHVEDGRRQWARVLKVKELQSPRTSERSGTSEVVVCDEA